MKVKRPQKDIIEIFGYAPNDKSEKCRLMWKLGACPFIGRQCNKTNHDKTIVYGTCAVTSPKWNCIICPNRLYANDYQTLRIVAKDAFGNAQFLTYEEYIKHSPFSGKAVIALGMHSGHEIGLKSFAMDWILAEVNSGSLKSYTGIEMQGIDITGNYRDTWHAYKNLKSETDIIPSSRHGLNWANVHKRLIPQIIRKSLIYSRSRYVKSGLYFIAPEIVYQKFEEIIGHDIPLQNHKGA